MVRTLVSLMRALNAVIVNIVGIRCVWPRGPRLQNKAEAGKGCERGYEDTKTTRQQNNVEHKRQNQIIISKSQRQQQDSQQRASN